MILQQLVDLVTRFLTENQYLALALIAGLGLLLWKKPAVFFKLAGIAAVIAAGLYVLSFFDQAVETGVVKKKEITVERAEHLNRKNEYLY